MELLLISVAIVGFTLALDKLTPPDARKVRKILGRATIVPIDKTADGGAAVVRGTVALTDGFELIAPLSRRPCVCWLVVFDEVGAKDFVELGRAQESVTTFLLRSEAGTARVVPEGAMLGPAAYVASIPMPRELHDPTKRRHHDQILDLALRTCTLRPNHLSTQLRVTEYAITTASVVTVGGLVAHEADPEGAADVVGYRNALPVRPVFSGSRRARLMIC